MTKRVLAALLVLITAACAWEMKTRTVGQKDPYTEQQKAQQETIQALAGALQAIATGTATPTPTPSPSPTPSPVPEVITSTGATQTVVSVGEYCELRACDFWDGGCPTIPAPGPCLDGKPLSSSAADIHEAQRRAQFRLERERALLYPK